MSLETITIPALSGQPPIGQIVLLHGWGANYDDLASLVPELNLPEYQFICANAPFPHYSVPQGRAWYSLEREDYQGLEDSRYLLKDWLKSLPTSTGIPLSRTILCGFSQGGAMTLDVGLRVPLAGLISLSGYLHSQPEPEINSLPPLLIVHGRQDVVVPLRAALQARDMLSALGVPVQYQELNMGHDITLEVMLLIRNFILSVLPLAC